jgi:hypothetical protein
MSTSMGIGLSVTAAPAMLAALTALCGLGSVLLSDVGAPLPDGGMLTAAPGDLVAVAAVVVLLGCMVAIGAAGAGASAARLMARAPPDSSARILWLGLSLIA